MKEMAEDVIIVGVSDLPAHDFAEMLAESEAASYRFLRRVADEWASGANRFSGSGEDLLIAKCSGRWVGICGLSIDPYLADPRTGRVRNVYVLADSRRKGTGRRLVQEAIQRAHGKFDLLRLRADDTAPARLYESLGFRRCHGVPNCTHIFNCSTTV